MEQQGPLLGHIYDGFCCRVDIETFFPTMPFWRQGGHIPDRVKSKLPLAEFLPELLPYFIPVLVL
jgi:hypothetical protein